MRAIPRVLLVLGLCPIVAACSASERSPLGGTWTAIAAPGIIITAKLEAPRFQFTADLRTLNGSTNCTDFSVPVSVTGTAIAIGEVVIRSPTSCTARDREIESAVVAALRQATEISGGLPSDRLILRGAGGELVLAQPTPAFPGDSE